MLKIRKRKGINIVKLKGNIDIHCSLTLAGEIYRVLEESGFKLIVDMKEVAFVDSSGLGILIKGLKKAMKHKGFFGLINVPENIYKIFEMTKLAKFLEIYEDVDQAIEEAHQKENDMESLHNEIDHLKKKIEKYQNGLAEYLKGKGVINRIEEEMSRLQNVNEMMTLLSEVYENDLREKTRLEEEKIRAERLAYVLHTAISISHEINNPLCSVLTAVQYLLLYRSKKVEYDSETMDYLKRIEDEVLRIAEVTGKLNRISKPVLKEYTPGVKMLDLDKSTDC